ncbi:MAG: hypothetical protein V7609_145 [Verrucomicrobiota bacterium]
MTILPEAMNRRTIRNLLFVLALVVGLAINSKIFAQVGNDNPTGPAGQFNGNLTTGCSYDPYTGNATRAITDMVVAGAVGNYPLTFSRVSNSRSASNSAYQFGGAGSWHHSYTWEIDGSEESLTPYFQPSSYAVYFPDGRTENFAYSASDPYFRAAPGVRERFIPINTSTMLAFLVLPDGGKIEFLAMPYSYFESGYGPMGAQSAPPSGQDSSQAAIGDPNGGGGGGYGTTYYGYHYRAQAIIDPYGVRTSLTYNGDGSLNVIQEPGGRWIQLVYVTTPWSGEVVIDHIQASDGRTVQYNYGQASYSPGTYGYTFLGNVVYYPDPAVSAPPIAYYSYQAPNAGYADGTPLLATADDPMYAGPMKKISYTYATGTNPDGSTVVAGQIHSENSGTTGQAVSTLTVTASGRSEGKPDGSLRYFLYNVGRVSSSTDFVNSVWAGQQYDATTGFVSSVTDRNGRTTNLTPDPLTGNVLGVTYPLTPGDTPSGTPAGTIAYTYGSASCPDPNNRDGNNPYYLYSSRDEAGNVTVYLRDANKRVTRINYPDGGYETFNYDAYGQAAYHQLKTGGTEVSFYDPSTHLRSSYRDPYHDSTGQTGSPTAWFQYDSLGRLTGVTDAQGYGPGDAWHTTNYQYNLRGQVTVTTLPIDPSDSQRHTIVNSYNSNNDGTLVSVTDALGHVTSYSYDDYRRLRTLTTPGNDTPRTALYFYDASGAGEDYTHTDSNVHCFKLPTGRKAVTVYDANLRKISETASGADGSEPATTSYTYDFAGNLKTTKSPKQQPGQPDAGYTAATYNYDERNRVYAVSDALTQSTTFKYDGGGRKLTEQRPNGQTVTYSSYDSMNRLLQQIVTQTPTPNAVTNYTWWPSGLLNTMQDPKGNTYAYSYDLMGRKLSTAYPPDSGNVTRSELYTHNALTGDPQTYTNRAGNVQTLFFDNLHRPTGFDWNDGYTPQQRIAYDAASRVRQIWNWDATIDFTYFNDDSLKTQTETTGDFGDNTPRTITYAYNADGNRSNVIYPSGRNYSYGYHARNDFEYVRDEATGIYQAVYNYDLNGNVILRYVGNWWRITDLGQRDALDRPTHIQHQLPSGTCTLDYQYNAMSSLTSVQRESGPPDTFGYDQAQQLTSTALSGPSTSFDYDANGNRTSMNGGGTYTPNGLNQFSTFNGQGVTYDANGNLASFNGWTYSYDAQNRLKTVSQGGTTMAQYWYDGLNRQITRNLNGAGITFHIWDGWNLIEERGTGGAIQNEYLYGAGEIVENLTTQRFYYQDVTGSTSHLSDDRGNLLERYTYSGFGQPSFYNAAGAPLPASTKDARHLFQGQLWTPQTGLNDHRNRQALPSMGVFLQPDPIRFNGDRSNLYRYCNNNPINSRDPSGMVTHEDGPGGKPAIPWVSINGVIGITVFGNGVETATTAGMGPRGNPSPLDRMGALPGEGASRDSGGGGGREGTLYAQNARPPMSNRRVPVAPLPQGEQELPHDEPDSPTLEDARRSVEAYRVGFEYLMRDAGDILKWLFGPLATTPGGVQGFPVPTPGPSSAPSNLPGPSPSGPPPPHG